MDDYSAPARDDGNPVAQSPIAQEEQDSYRPPMPEQFDLPPAPSEPGREPLREELVRRVEKTHAALQSSLASLKDRIEASNAGLYPTESLAADLEAHAEMTRQWTEAMAELARFYRGTETKDD